MENAHTYVTADAFREKVQKRVTKDIELTGIGKVKLQKLKLGEFDELETLATPEGGVQDNRLFARLLILASIVEPALPEDDVSLFDEMDAELFTQLSTEVNAMHGVNTEAHDDLVARFPDEGTDGDGVGDPDTSI